MGLWLVVRLKPWFTCLSTTMMWLGTSSTYSRLGVGSMVVRVPGEVVAELGRSLGVDIGVVEGFVVWLLSDYLVRYPSVGLLRLVIDVLKSGDSRVVRFRRALGINSTLDVEVNINNPLFNRLLTSVRSIVRALAKTSVIEYVEELGEVKAMLRDCLDRLCARQSIEDKPVGAGPNQAESGAGSKGEVGGFEDNPWVQIIGLSMGIEAAGAVITTTTAPIAVPNNNVFYTGRDADEIWPTDYYLVVIDCVDVTRHGPAVHA